jgi:membrane protease YdiL (CAAX protease family)
MSEIKSLKTLEYFLLIIVMLAVCMTLFTTLSNDIKLIIRVLFIIGFYLAWRHFYKKDRTTAKDLSFTFLALNLAFLVVSFFPSDFWGLEQESSKGFALSKLSDGLIISTVLILCFILGGYKLKSVYLTKGRLIPGFIIGILLFIAFGYLAINNPEQRIEMDFLERNYIWILIFVFANGFMEELIFRGILLKKLNRYMKPIWSIILTSICFAAPHLTVHYAQDVFYFFGIVFVLGMICGYAMHYTKSIIAPTLIHAGADLMIIIPVFATYGVIN